MYLTYQHISVCIFVFNLYIDIIQDELEVTVVKRL